MKRVSVALLLTAAILFAGAGCPSSPPETDAAEPPGDVSPAPAPETTEHDAGPADTEAGDTAQNQEDDGAGADAPDPTGGASDILPESDDRALEDSDLAHLNNWELTLARNEIFARHGRPFVNEEIHKHFQGCGWYSPDEDYTDAWLSLTERKNAEFILEYQKLKYDIPARRP